MDVIIVFLTGLAIPGSMMVPYLIAAYRFNKYMETAGWQPPNFAEDMLTRGPLKAVERTTGNQSVLQSRVELGDYGPEAAELLQRMRRRQVIGIVLAGLTWMIGVVKGETIYGFAATIFGPLGDGTLVLVVVFVLVAIGATLSTRYWAPRVGPTARRRLLLAYVVGLASLVLGLVSLAGAK